MNENTAQPTIYKTPAAKRNVAVSFVPMLALGDLLTGTPTVAVTPTGPTLSVAAVNTATMKIELPDNAKYHALAGQAVTFSVAGGTAGTYSISVQCNTVGGQNPLELFVTLVIGST